MGATTKTHNFYSPETGKKDNQLVWETKPELRLTFVKEAPGYQLVLHILRVTICDVISCDIGMVSVIKS